MCLRVPDRDGADGGELLGHAERRPELGLIRDPEEDRAEPGVDGMRTSIAAIPVSISQYGTSQRFSSMSVQPLSGSA
jgi:hypothetical protein